MLGGLSPSTRQVADIRESRLARRESVEQRRNYEMGLMDKDCIEYSTTCRGNRRIFTRRDIAEHLTAKRDARILSVHAKW